ncbi:hypothetical protein BDZ97DRAFT_95370 [Flammula alnicola]|nr:hypothetical protein BDZ97DRAFT_95370 [Flammula alnicola]
MSLHLLTSRYWNNGTHPRARLSISIFAFDISVAFAVGNPGCHYSHTLCSLMIPPSDLPRVWNEKWPWCCFTAISFKIAFLKFSSRG